MPKRGHIGSFDAEVKNKYSNEIPEVSDNQTQSVLFKGKDKKKKERKEPW